MIIAQISDMHIRPHGQLAYRRVDTAWFLARCVEQLGRMAPRPDIVLATGDLVDAGHPDEYRHLRELLGPLPMPVYLIPGNHDDRDALAREFGDHAYLPREGRFLHYVLGASHLAQHPVGQGEHRGAMRFERRGAVGHASPPVLDDRRTPNVTETTSANAGKQRELRMQGIGTGFPWRHCRDLVWPMTAFLRESRLPTTSPSSRSGSASSSNSANNG